MDIAESDVKYVDVDDALNRVGGNMSLYIKLLGRFAEGKYVEAIEEAIGNGDMEEAARQAHALKGVSANLSLNIVRALSVELEEKIHKGAEYADHLAKMKQAHDATIKKIAEITGCGPQEASN